MLIDSRNEFCDAVALNTGAAGTYLLGDVIDLGVSSRDIGVGQPLWFVAQIETAATSGGSATLQMKLVSDAQAALATDGSASEHFVSAAIAVAALTAGKSLITVAIPLEGVEYERYLGVLQVTAVVAFTGGTINCFLTNNAPKWTAYPDGDN